MARRFCRLAALVLLSALLSASSLNAATRVFVRISPPAPVVEIRSAPRTGHVWQPGYHRWRNERYEWERGRWVRPPHRGAVWSSGRWEHERRGWYWVPGHWSR
jgi:hypothetical protein